MPVDHDATIVHNAVKYVEAYNAFMRTDQTKPDYEEKRRAKATAHKHLEMSVRGKKMAEHEDKLNQTAGPTHPEEIGRCSKSPSGFHCLAWGEGDHCRYCGERG